MTKIKLKKGAIRSFLTTNPEYMPRFSVEKLNHDHEQLLRLLSQDFTRNVARNMRKGIRAIVRFEVTIIDDAKFKKSPQTQ